MSFTLFIEDAKHGFHFVQDKEVFASSLLSYLSIVVVPKCELGRDLVKWKRTENDEKEAVNLLSNLFGSSILKYLTKYEKRIKDHFNSHIRICAKFGDKCEFCCQAFNKLDLFLTLEECFGITVK